LWKDPLECSDYSKTGGDYSEGAGACLEVFAAVEIERRPRGASRSAWLGIFSALEIERRPRGASRSACLGIFSALEIERRPRGASRASPLLHLLQRAMA